jgi:hypothetical protein
MKLSKQAMGAIMMALQKCLMEETDIVPLLETMNFQVDGPSQSELIVLNPPVVSLANVEPATPSETVETSTEEDTTESNDEEVLVQED